MKYETCPRRFFLCFRQNKIEKVIQYLKCSFKVWFNGVGQNLVFLLLVLCETNRLSLTLIDQ